LVSVPTLRVISYVIAGSTQLDPFTHSSVAGVITKIQAGAVLSKVIVEPSVSEFVFVAKSSIATLIDIVQSGSQDVILRLYT